MSAGNLSFAIKMYCTKFAETSNVHDTVVVREQLALPRDG